MMTKSSNVRIPWTEYYCTNHPKLLRSTDGKRGCLISCPICFQHFNNIQFVRHIISHMLTDQLSLGNLISQKLCPECVSIPEHLTLSEHYKLHRHVENIDPLALFNKCYVCPICECTFPSIVTFATHLYERHIYQDSPYICTVCYSFRSSYYCELLSHFHSVHQGSNNAFCPYCLKYFEFQILSTLLTEIPIFDGQDFYNHIYQHWTEDTHRCGSCRLDFLHRKDLKMHIYLNHAGNPHKNMKFPGIYNTGIKQNNNKLSIDYFYQLSTRTPRVFLKCLECKERLRPPLSKHYSLTVNCTYCKYASSCQSAVNWHYYIHTSNPYPNPLIFHNLKKGQNCICTTDVLNTKPRICSLLTYDSQSLRKSKEKHISPAIFYKGILKCSCGFRTILCDQMARHLVTKEHSVAFQDFSPRLKIFNINVRKSKSIKTSLWWNKRLSRTPTTLRSVGLCQRSDSNICI